MRDSRVTDRPLPPPVLYILLCLAEGERHGYAIMQDISQRSGGRIQMGPGTLYTSLQRALEAGYVSEARLRREDERSARGRQPYRLTAAGRQAARRELARLDAVMRMARNARLTPATEEKP